MFCIEAPIQKQMIPKCVARVLIAQLLVTSDDDDDMIHRYHPEDNIFLFMVHAVLKLRADISNHRSYQGMRVKKEDTLHVSLRVCIPS